MNDSLAWKLLLVAVLVATIPTDSRSVDTPTRTKARLLVVAHRGLLRHAPENTVAAFQSCLALRMGFELDVQRSRDGKLVCVHDVTLDRTTDGKGKVNARTWAALQTLDAGSWFSPTFRGERIPSVDAVFAMIAKHAQQSVLVAVDVKIDDPAVERDLVRLAKKHGVLSRLVFIGRTIISPAMRRKFKTANKAVRVARLAASSKEVNAVLADGNADWVYVRFLPTAAEVARIHQAGKRIILVGTRVAGQEPKNWQAGVNAGVDAILTDYPLELRRIVRGKH